MAARPIAAALLLVMSALTSTAADRAPVPDDAAVEKATNDIRTVYKADFAKKSPADVRALAAKLFQTGLETQSDPAARFVLIREAVDQAQRGGDHLLAIQAASRLAAEYQVDGVATRAGVLEKAAAAAPVGNPAVHYQIAVTALETADDAVAADRFAEAVRLVGLAAKSVPRAKDSALTKRVAARAAEVKEAAAEYPAAKAAAARLAADPADATAGRAAGRFRCLFKGDWAGGLPLLAEFGEDPLKGLARKDLDAPAKPDDQAALADAYWQRAGKEKGAAAAALRRRAGHWYRQALPGLGVLNRDRAARRIEEADPYAPLAGLDLTNGTPTDDYVRVKNFAQVATLAEYTGPVEVRVVARTKGNNIRLHGPNGSCVIFNWELNQRELRVTRPDGVNGRLESGSIATAAVKPLAADTWYTLRWRMTATQIDVWVDDKLVFTEKGRYNLSARSPVKVGAMEHAVDIRSLAVKAVK